MDIQNIKKDLKKRGLTYSDIATTANIPINTIKSIFSGRTANPRIDTMKAIENAIQKLTNNEMLMQTKINYNLTTEEIQLIKTYRALSPGKKSALFEMLEIDTTVSKDKNQKLS